MPSRFSEMNKVRVICEQFGKYEGYVLASQFRDGRWIYKVSISEDPASANPTDTFDNVYNRCLRFPFLFCSFSETNVLGQMIEPLHLGLLV